MCYRTIAITIALYLDNSNSNLAGSTKDQKSE